MAIEGKKAVTATVRKGYFISQFALIQAGVPVIDAIKMTVSSSEDFRMKSFEIEDVAIKAGLDIQQFTDFIKEIGAYVESKGSISTGETRTRINSEERALEVLNSPSPENVARYIELTTQLIAIKKELDSMINHNGDCSLAIRNKKKDENGAESVETENFETPEDAE